MDLFASAPGRKKPKFATIGLTWRKSADSAFLSMTVYMLRAQLRFGRGARHIVAAGDRSNSRVPIFASCLSHPVLRPSRVMSRLMAVFVAHCSRIVPRARPCANYGPAG
jgi:hypothetical protein